MSSVIRKYQRVVPDLEEVRRNKYKSVYIENAAIITKEGFHIDLHIFGSIIYGSSDWLANRYSWFKYMNEN